MIKDFMQGSTILHEFIGMTTIHDFTSYYTFSLVVANNAENAQMNQVRGKDHDQKCLSKLTL